MRALLLASAVMCGGIGAAAAAPITATYDFAATYFSGPNATISGSVTLTYDPTTSGAIQVSNFMSGALSAYTPVTAGHPGGLANLVNFGNDCPSRFCDVVTGVNSFYEFFQVNERGDVVTAYGLPYSAGGRAYVSRTDTVTRRPPVAVPEPATFALLGLPTALAGLVALRRRKARSS